MRWIHVLALLFMVGKAVPAALADHIDGHDDDDPVHPVPIPGQDFFSGGAMWVTAIGPVGGREILNTRFDITFVSDGATPASELLLNVGLLVEDGMGGDVYVETVLTGADLGFGDEPGTYRGTWETADLNGIAIPGFFPPYSLVDLIVGATNGGIDGTAYFVDSYVYFDLVPVPAPAGAALLGVGALAATRRRRA